MIVTLAIAPEDLGGVAVHSVAVGRDEVEGLVTRKLDCLGGEQCVPPQVRVK
jgi:hypothetical protein